MPDSAFKFYANQACVDIKISSVTYGRRTEPVNSDITNNTRKRKKINFAIPAAPAAIPPNPKMAAMIATIRNMIVQRNISVCFKFNLYVANACHSAVKAGA